MTVLRFSANLGYLWKELPFLERIRRAAATPINIAKGVRPICKGGF